MLEKMERSWAGNSLECTVAGWRWRWEQKRNVGRRQLRLDEGKGNCVC
jgi:hypothetical protein